MGAKLEHAKVLNVPGPGTYQSSLVDKTSTKNVKFGSEARGEMAKAGAAKLPGPGEHAPDFKAIKQASPRFGFGSEKRASPINEKLAAMPGPGNYQLP